MLLYRVLSALIGIPLIVGLLWMGGLAWLGAVLIVALIGLWEMFNIIEQTGCHAMREIGIVNILIMFVLSYMLPDSTGLNLSLVLSTYLIIMVFTYPRLSQNDVGINFFAVIYVGWFILHLFLLRELPNGFAWVMFVFLANWATDTAAYFAGRAFGKNKLAPSVSPKKTVEGSIGGLIGSVIVVTLFTVFNQAFANESIWIILPLALFISIVGQIGDLAESAMKRYANIKDSGHLIPGHGGVLDRFDSVLLTTPLAYYYIHLFII